MTHMVTALSYIVRKVFVFSAPKSKVGTHEVKRDSMKFVVVSNKIHLLSLPLRTIAFTSVVDISNV